MALIVLEGTDGSGKGTQTQMLVNRLQKEGKSVAVYDFPRYHKDGCEGVQHYLNGGLGDIHETGPYGPSLLFATDRLFAKKDLLQDIETNDYVICNRYTTSNMVHQAAKIDNYKDFLAYIDWVSDLEYKKLGFPIPHAVFFLDMPWEIGYVLISQKDTRAYIKNGQRDMHEWDKDFMQNSYNRACELATIQNWVRIPCSHDKKTPDSVQDIHEKIFAELLNIG